MTAGSLAAAIFGALTGDFVTYFVLLAYLLGLGILWDVVYNWAQHFRWDRDWPPFYQLITGTLEGLLLYYLIGFAAGRGIPTASGLPGLGGQILLTGFFEFYALLWVFVFIGTQGPLRVLFPRWRYRGGRWL